MLIGNGRNQVIRKEKEVGFDSDEKVIIKNGNSNLLIQKASVWDSFIRSVDMFSDDYMKEDVRDDIKQVREEL